MDACGKAGEEHWPLINVRSASVHFGRIQVGTWKPNQYQFRSA
jgi:hypothetical protein